MLIDLHCHSTASDGADSPSALIHLAYTQGVRALALTDHDTLTGLDEAYTQAQKDGLLFLYGVEIEINTQRGVFHLLGLNLRPQNQGAMQQLQDALLQQQRQRDERNLYILEELKKLGIICDYEEIRASAKDVVGRVHIAQYLHKKGYVKSQQAAFDKYLANGRPAYIRKDSFDLAEAVHLIHQAEGKAIIAHPLSLYQSWRMMGETFLQYKELGIDGLEAYHSNCKINESQRLATMAKELDWLVTGGSDYHGAKYLSRRLGHATAGQKIDKDLLVPLLREDQKLLWEKMQEE